MVAEWCEREKVQCLYLLLPGDDTRSAHEAGELGFRFVDIRTTLEQKTTPRELKVVANIRQARPEDVPVLERIAAVSHVDSRFYADPGFSPERSSCLYQTWIRRSCLDGYAKTTFVYELNGSPAGYITCDWSGNTGSIGLLGVAAEARGAGVGKALVHAALKLLTEQGTEQIRVVTQGRNIAAQRLYHRCGFLPSSVEIWFHRWF